jgi:hypothetical protein
MFYACFGLSIRNAITALVYYLCLIRAYASNFSATVCDFKPASALHHSGL